MITLITKALGALQAIAGLIADDDRNWFADLIATAIREKRDLTDIELSEISSRTGAGLDELQALIDAKRDQG